MNNLAPNDKMLVLDQVSRRFGELEVLRDVNLTLRRGESLALLGPSGSGKSSLLHIAGLLEKASSGEVIIDGAITSSLNDRERTLIRRDDLGFVYQFHHLLPEFDALGNVCLPQLIKGKSKKEAEIEALRLLSLMGLKERTHHQPGQLSGGEQQRTAIARALANKPKILLADEPTGNLDVKTSDTVFDALIKLVREEGLCAVIATHDHNLAKKMDRVMTISEMGLVDWEG